MEKLLISLFDYTGNASKPYKDNGWRVIQVDTKHGIDVMAWNYIKVLQEYDHALPEVGIIAMVPCTAYALCGNRHKNTPARKIIFKESQELVAKTKEIIDFFDNVGILKFWQIENPMSDIHTHNQWLGKIRANFNPCDFAGYDPSPNNSRYNKRTWLWGNFKKMTLKRIEPFSKDSPIWTKYGGKSERTKELRSTTPLGFANAFYDANH